jgi:hypothetical protein
MVHIALPRPTTHPFKLLQATSKKTYSMTFYVKGCFCWGDAILFRCKHVTNIYDAITTKPHLRIYVDARIIISIYRSIYRSIYLAIIRFFSVLFCSVLFYSIPFCLLCSVLFCSILTLFCLILFFSILCYSILLYTILFYFVLLYSILLYPILSISLSINNLT